MKLTSPAFGFGEKIPPLYTCNGKNISPELCISDVPQAAKSLVLIMDDPDVPSYIRKDQMWVHWVVFNIPPTVAHIPSNTTPPGLVGTNTGGALAYQGPCPPDREHRYFFKLYALNTQLDLAEGSTKAEVERAMQGHILEQTELMGLYVQGCCDCHSP